MIRLSCAFLFSIFYFANSYACVGSFNEFAKIASRNDSIGFSNANFNSQLLEVGRGYLINRLSRADSSEEVSKIKNKLRNNLELSLGEKELVNNLVFKNNPRLNQVSSNQSVLSKFVKGVDDIVEKSDIEEMIISIKTLEPSLKDEEVLDRLSMRMSQCIAR